MASMTGYTECVVKRDVTFEHFLWVCAQGWDEYDPPRGVQIEYKVDTNDYYHQEKARLEAEIKEIEPLSEQAFGERMAAKRRTEIENYERWADETRAVRGRLQVMLKEATAWEPPTDDHAGLKAFMLRQLQQTLDANSLDYYEEFHPKNKVLPTKAEYLNKQRAEIQRHAVQIIKAERIAEEMTRWRKALRKAVAIPDTIPMRKDEDRRGG